MMPEWQISPPFWHNDRFGPFLTYTSRGRVPLQPDSHATRALQAITRGEPPAGRRGSCHRRTAMAPDRDLAQLYAETYERLHGPLRDHAERLLSKDDARDAVGDAMADSGTSGPRSRTRSGTTPTCSASSATASQAKRRENRIACSCRSRTPSLRARPRAPCGGHRRRPAATTAAEVLDAALAAMTARRREVFLLVRSRASPTRGRRDPRPQRGTIKAPHVRKAVEELRAAFARAGFRITDPQRRQLPSPKGGDTND
jgi:DNA-directed RNA polymerase specialized sigma24 family protein